MKKLFPVDKSRSDYFNEVFYNSPTLQFIVNENINILNANNSIADFTQKSEKDLSGGLPGIALRCFRASIKPGCGGHEECETCPLRSAIKETLNSGKPVKNREASFILNGKAEKVHFHTLISTSLICQREEKAVLISITDISLQKAAEGELKRVETKFKTFAEYTYDWEFWSSSKDEPIYHSPSCKRITGYSPKEFIENPGLLRDIIHPEDQHIWDSHQTNPLTGITSNKIIFRIITADGDICWLEHICTRVYDDEGNYTGLRGRNKDITENIQLELLYKAQLKLSELSLKCTLDELLQAALDEAELLTHSKIGFFHFVEPDQKNLNLQMWSTNTIKNMCTASGKGDHYSIDKAGVWVECVYARKPMIHNDYENLTHKKGLPEGHAPVIRELVIPIIRNDKIVAILGVGNKPINYTQKDIELTTKLTDLVWDIVHKKRIEEELIKSEEKYRFIVENQSDLIIKTDPEGCLIFVSQSYCNLLGKKEEELINKSYIPYIFGDDRESTLIIMKDIYKPPHHCYIENRILLKDGFRWIGWNNKAVFNKNGSLELIISSGRDISEKRIAEDALKASEEKFSKAFHISPDSININRMRDGLYINVNQGFTELTGYQPEEVIGRTSLEINIWNNAEDRKKLVAGLLKNGEYSNLEAEFKIKDGGIKTCLMSAKILNINNEACILSITHDISDRIKAEEELKKSLVEKETLLRELYHRTKNNMQVISAMLTLQAESVTNPRFMDILDETNNRIRAMSLVHQMLYSSKDLSKIYFGDYIKELIELLVNSYNIDKTRIEIDFSLSDEKILIDYAIPCGLIINEIISNAFKYAFPNDSKGRIGIIMNRDEKNRIQLIIKDNGTGFPPGFDYRCTSTIGFQLIFTLVEHQLDGIIDVRSDNGVEIRFAFYDNLYDIRV